MYSIRYDSKKNRLYLTFEGMLSPEEVNAATAEGVRIINEHLKTGFDVVTDMRKYRASTTESAEKIGQAQNILIELGVSRFVRVVKSVVGKMQFMRLGTERGIKAAEALTIAQADELLDND